MYWLKYYTCVLLLTYFHVYFSVFSCFCVDAASFGPLWFILTVLLLMFKCQCYLRFSHVFLTFSSPIYLWFPFSMFQHISVFTTQHYVFWKLLYGELYSSMFRSSVFLILHASLFHRYNPLSQESLLPRAPISIFYSW